jgi:hypothetical protein
MILRSRIAATVFLLSLTTVLPAVAAEISAGTVPLELSAEYPSQLNLFSAQVVCGLCGEPGQPCVPPDLPCVGIDTGRDLQAPPASPAPSGLKILASQPSLALGLPQDFLTDPMAVVGTAATVERFDLVATETVDTDCGRWLATVSLAAIEQPDSDLWFLTDGSMAGEDGGSLSGTLRAQVLVTYENLGTGEVVELPQSLSLAIGGRWETAQHGDGCPGVSTVGVSLCGFDPKSCSVMCGRTPEMAPPL